MAETRQRLTALAAAIVLTITACGSDDDGPSERLGKAACADLRNGLSLFQIASGGLDRGMSRKEIASALILGIEDDCPEFEDELKASMIYTDWINE